MKKVLIVDDAAFMRVSLRLILENNGFQVVGEAVNGLQAVEMYKELAPDLVTMDITMPEMTGLEAVKAIKVFDENARIVMVSAMGQQSFIAEAIKSGAKYFILKPFKEEHVIQTLNIVGA